MTVDNATAQLELHDDTLLVTLRSIIEAEFHLPHAEQVLSFQSQPLLPSRDDMTLSSLGLSDGAIVLVNSTRRSSSASAIARPTGRNIADLWRALSSASETLLLTHDRLMRLDVLRPQPTDNAVLEEAADALLSRAVNEPNLSSIVAQHDPDLADALVRRQRSDIIAGLKRRRDAHHTEMAEQRRRWEQALRDPMSVEAQELLLQQIQQQQIDEAYMHAQEFLPESFGSVFMVYVRIQVNNIGLTAFVDSGAQCGLMRLVDKRFHGVAQGVGTGKIVGRIHVTQIKLGQQYFAASIIVLEDAHIDFLFGLDLLRRHQCILDFQKNVLRVEGEELPFLSEHEAKKPEASVDDVLEKSSSSNVQTTGASQDFPTTPTLRPTEQGRAKREIEDELIQRVMSIGATREEAIALLEQTGWNPDLAASLLFQQQE